MYGAGLRDELLRPTAIAREVGAKCLQGGARSDLEIHGCHDATRVDLALEHK